MTTREVLVAARRLLEDPKDWAQGVYVSLDGAPYCVATALYAATPEVIPEQQEEAREALLPNCSLTAPGWNDVSWRTHDEVLAVFDRAIASLA